MPVTYKAVDNEFAVATAGNVGTTENSSTFDNPPEGSKDLVVTSNDNDANPGLFELGETYDVTWGGQSGGGMIKDAVVIRSDEAPGGGGIVVFEGIDENGAPAQVIWTPDFDLEGWYNANFNPSMEPQYYTTDQQAAYTHQINCFGAGTRIETARGQSPIELIKPGDIVRTWRGTWSRVVHTRHRIERGRGPGAPVYFPARSIGNRQPLVLSKQHRIFAQHPMLHLYYGHAAMLIPAIAYAGLGGIALRPTDQIHYVHLCVQYHDAIKAEGTWCETLFQTGTPRQRLIAPALTVREATCVLPQIISGPNRQIKSKPTAELAVC